MHCLVVIKQVRKCTRSATILALSLFTLSRGLKVFFTTLVQNFASQTDV